MCRWFALLRPAQVHASVDGRAVFQSVVHPEGRSWAAVYSGRLVRPLAVCLLPVMIFTLVDALQGFSLLVYLYLLAPLAILVALAWTSYQMRAAVAELQVEGPHVWVRTLSMCLRDQPAAETQYVLEVRQGSESLQVTLSQEALVLPFEQWPEHRALRDALRSAQEAR